jgi:hypothetical protein
MTLLAVTALVVTVGVVAGPAAAVSTNAADDEPLVRISSTGGTCGDPTIAGTTTECRVIIKKGNGEVSATVTLKDGLPNTVYEVALTTTPSGSFCFGSVGRLRTNNQGNGTGRVSVPLVSGDTGAYVFLFTQFSPSDRLQSPVQVFGTK